MSVPVSARAQAFFARFEEAARVGARCPTKAQLRDLGRAHEPRQELLRAGLIKIDIYGSNWRVVTILAGPCAGLSTAPPLHEGEPWRTLDHLGDHGIAPAEPQVHVREPAWRPSRTPFVFSNFIAPPTKAQLMAGR